MNARVPSNKKVNVFTAVIGRKVCAGGVKKSNAKIVGSAAREKFKFLNVRRKIVQGYTI